MRFVVAGAGGFIGSACVKELLNRGHEIAVIRRAEAEHSRLIGLELQVLDASLGYEDAQFVRDLTAFGADAMLNLAWQGVANFARNESSQFENVEMHLSLARASVAAGISHYVGVGSQAEYGPTEGPVTESQILLPTTMYGAAKGAAGLATRALLSDTETHFTWVRIFSMFGPNDAPHWMIPSIARKLMRNDDVDSTLGTQLWDYLYVEDAARAFSSILELGQGLEFVNLGSGAPTTIRAVIEQMKAITGSTSRLKFGAVDFRPDQVMHLEANISKLNAATGWSPQVSLVEGLTLTLHALQNETADAR